MTVDIGTWQSVALTVVGLIFLVGSADRFLDGAAAAAKTLGCSPIFIGLTVVSLGTSAPEILVALTAAIGGEPEIALGNVIGSNIANVGLVLGLTAMILSLPFSSSVLRIELPWLLLGTALVVFCSWDLHLSLNDGLWMLSVLLLIGWFTWRNNRGQANTQNIIASEVQSFIPDLSLKKSIWYFCSGLIVLLISAKVLVIGATSLAQNLNVSDIIIGLTVVAVGTSLPELAATVGSALKGHPDIAIGNVVGSNIMNILLILPIPAIISSPQIDATILYRDYGTMVILTLMLALFAHTFGRNRISRIEGAILFSVWVAYNAVLYVQA